MDINEKNKERMYDDFYKKLRRKIERQLNSWKRKKRGKKRTPYDVLVELLFLLPDLFHLGVKLLFNKNLPSKNKGALLAGIVYVVSPIDLIPDVIPIAGWVDDLIVMAMALNRFFDTEDKRVAGAVKKYWAGDEDVFKIVKHVIEVADSAVKFLPSELMKMIRGIFKGR